MRFRGRLITRLDVGKKIMNSFTEEIGDIESMEKKPVLEGNTIVLRSGTPEEIVINRRIYLCQR